MKSPSREEIERSLERFIAGELLEERYDGRDPLAARVVDSLGIEQIVTYIEEEFGVRLTDEDLVEESFESLSSLAAVVDTRRAAR